MYNIETTIFKYVCKKMLIKRINLYTLISNLMTRPSRQKTAQADIDD